MKTNTSLAIQKSLERIEKLMPSIFSCSCKNCTKARNKELLKALKQELEKARLDVLAEIIKEFEGKETSSKEIARFIFNLKAKHEARK